ncbi:hypothetical protein HC931_25795 [Candidatus Gracilibacteria bacterium]|nr:hypothetical protein [Candidatus Gracilibacteria bacterium]NJM89719.1 hypothetical protein [Hydrococcus sp. RU_2_2]NJP22010.1 hypothetical protein [Hydrococcus sp. CRU_1_1]
MKNLLLLPEQLFLKSPNLLKAVMVLDSEGQPLARAGELVNVKDSNILVIVGYAILALSKVKEEFHWQEQQISLKTAQGTVIVLKIKEFYLFLVAFPHLDEKLRILLKQIENFVMTSPQVERSIEAKSSSYLTINSIAIENQPKKVTWDGDIFLTRCERELSQLFDRKLVKILIAKYYSLARKNRAQFLQALGQKIHNPIERNSFLEVMQPFG